MADIAIVVFPGSNCDRDAFHVFSHLLHRSVVYHWHEEPLKPEYKLVILPGGFSYGDYLRAGAIARFSTVVDSIPNYLKSGGKVLGICNGFQILIESGLLPGLLLKNESLRFQCEQTYVKVEENNSPLFKWAELGKALKMPIAHSQGKYVVPQNQLAELTEQGQIFLRYCDSNGQTSQDSNVNGSDFSIAGVTNKEGNILGLMPHPERASEILVGSEDGLRFLKWINEAI